MASASVVVLRRSDSGRKVEVKVGWSWTLFFFTPFFGLPLAWRGLWNWTFFIMALYVLIAISAVGVAIARSDAHNPRAMPAAQTVGAAHAAPSAPVIPRSNPNQPDSAGFTVTLGDAKVAGSLEWDPSLTMAAESFARSHPAGHRSGRHRPRPAGLIGALAIGLLAGLMVVFGMRGSAIVGRHLLENHGFQFDDPHSPAAQAARAAWSVNPPTPSTSSTPSS